MPNVIDPNVRAVDFDPRLRKSKDFQPGRIDRALMAVATRSQALRAFTPGIDVSKWNTVTSWREAYNAGYRFTYIKACEGVSYVDPKFTEHCEGALEAGFVIGTYGFFRSNLPGREQALFYLDTIAPVAAATGGKMLPMKGDVETTDGVTVAVRRVRLTDYLTTLGTAAGVYSSKYLWTLLTNNMPLDRGNWVASWTSASVPTMPIGWNAAKVKFWQKGIAGKHSWLPSSVPGIVGQVDYNLFLGSEAELRALAGITEPTLEERVTDLERRVEILEQS